VALEVGPCVWAVNGIEYPGLLGAENVVFTFFQAEKSTRDLEPGSLVFWSHGITITNMNKSLLHGPKFSHL
jgi:hypothetical protein